ncbi:S8 family serine peptidase [Mycoplasma sp. NEAQ87857]|uniref:S8 family peptidase n=1 Tax=Mycoplasma sp. NEAQ87857 TaxID=2683967 RepID=UPI001316B0DD|nr:S8 family peptidase [Mycoplasma sp. NEAQ87857]QGZ97900.1 S8 family serine peptidase [Mycoplasma sp. NEAQ87857]
MNNVLELKSIHFEQNSWPSHTGFNIKMNGNFVVTSGFLLRLEKQLQDIQSFWNNESRFFKGILLSVNYNKIAAKSNRIRTLLMGDKSNEAVVGAKFNKEKTKHIITYLIRSKNLNKSIKLLQKTRIKLDKFFNGKMDHKTFDNKNIVNSNLFDKNDLSISAFKGVIADASYIESFSIEKASFDLKQNLITIFDVKQDTISLFKELGIDILSTRILDNNTVFLDDDQLKILMEKAPYLVSMSTVDITKLDSENYNSQETKSAITIPEPANEPTIGVIDTLFDENVYFSKWVDFRNEVSNNVSTDLGSYAHGTTVSSIIVDGPTLNPWLDDGCGRFKVRHFGVTNGKNFSSFSIIKKIKAIIAANRDIRVWNISLGSDQEINDNFISAEAAILDEIQYKNNVIFVIAGTNKKSRDKDLKIGSPADSINALVVNSVTKDNESAVYSRKGPALSFFLKPDVSYYGGSKECKIKAYDPNGEVFVTGTSYAAPWIARKLSYLIDVLELNREVAKAMIIDAARGWNDQISADELALYGHGIVPIHINQIIKSEKDEIKFVISDISKEWNTFNYNFPVPLKDDKFHYFAKATMCYFPRCNRNQGVDYTNTELNIHFGRVNDNKTIIDIKNKKQNDDEIKQNPYLYETEVREQYRKWDNVKYIAESINKRPIAKKSYSRKTWGLEIKTSKRSIKEKKEGIRFGVVITLKEHNGINRIDEFIRECHWNKWQVNPIIPEKKIQLNNRLSQKIEFN